MQHLKNTFYWVYNVWIFLNQSTGSTINQDILQECLRTLQIGPEAGRLISSSFPPHCCSMSRKQRERVKKIQGTFQETVFYFLQLFHRGHRSLRASSRATAAAESGCDWWTHVAWATTISSSSGECRRWSWVAGATRASNRGSCGRGLWRAAGAALHTEHGQDQRGRQSQ